MFGSHRRGEGGHNWEGLNNEIFAVEVNFVNMLQLKLKKKLPIKPGKPGRPACPFSPDRPGKPGRPGWPISPFGPGKPEEVIRQ